MTVIQIITTIGYVESSRPALIKWSYKDKYRNPIEHLESLKNLIIEFVTVNNDLKVVKCCSRFKKSENANFCAACGVRIVDPADTQYQLAESVSDFLNDLSCSTFDSTSFHAAWDHFEKRGWSFNCNPLVSGQLIEIDQFDEWVKSDSRFGEESRTWYGDCIDSKVTIKKR